jgi:hypothetical protein
MHLVCSTDQKIDVVFPTSTGGTTVTVLNGDGTASAAVDTVTFVSPADSGITEYMVQSVIAGVTRTDLVVLHHWEDAPTEGLPPTTPPVVSAK